MGLSARRPRGIVAIIDVWDTHHCVGAIRQVEENVDAIDAFAAERRAQGFVIVHAPGGRTSPYSEHPSRARLARRFVTRSRARREKNHIAIPRTLNLPALRGCVCDSTKPCFPKRRTWTRQHHGLHIDPSDIVSDSLVEVQSLLGSRPREAQIVGFHLNGCVLSRPLGWFRLSSWIEDTTIIDRLVWSFAPTEEEPDIRSALRASGVPLIEG